MKRWHYEPAQDLDQPMIERLRRFPREPDITIYLLRSLAAMLVRGWLRFYHRLQIIGRENLPLNGSFVMVANHASHLDALCLLAALPLRKLHRVFPAAAADYFFVSVPRVALAAIVVNALPFSRKLKLQHSLRLCQHLLANSGNVLILFPEGSRSTTGRIGEFKPGIGLLVAGTNVPVVPCHLDGTFEAWPKGALWPRPRRLRLKIGTPRCFTGLPQTKESARDIARTLQEAVEVLAG